jgi:hypothetical protein
MIMATMFGCFFFTYGLLLCDSPGFPALAFGEGHGPHGPRQP